MMHTHKNNRYYQDHELPSCLDIVNKDTNAVHKSFSFGYRLIMIILVTFLSLISWSCSSQPQRSISPIVSEADNLYRLGKQFTVQGDNSLALKSYQLALERYSLVDYLDGIILTKIAVIGTKARNNNETIDAEDLDSLRRLIEQSAPQYYANLLLLKTELYFLNKQYEKVLELTEKINAPDRVLESQLLCYRLMALTKENLSGDEEYHRLQRNAKRLRRAYRRRKIDEMGIYSYINYVMGYYNIQQGIWHEATKYFLKSLKIDKETDNINGIAKNLYYIALSFEEQQQIPKAIIYYERASKVFHILEQQDTVNRITRKLSLLKTMLPENK